MRGEQGRGTAIAIGDAVTAIIKGLIVSDEPSDGLADPRQKGVGQEAAEDCAESDIGERIGHAAMSGLRSLEARYASC